LPVATAHGSDGAILPVATEAVSKAVLGSVGNRSGLGSCPAVERLNAMTRATPGCA